MATKKVTKSEQLAAEATIRKPAGAPEFVPLIALSRRKRAEFVKALAVIQHKADVLDRVSDGEVEKLEDGAAVLELLADIEDLLRVVAVDPDEFGEWVAKCSDTDLTDALNWYMERNPLGEPKASPA